MMTITKNIFLASMLIMGTLNSVQADTIPSLFGFAGQTILSISDADMVASAYTDGKLGEREGSDVLSIIQFDDSENQYSSLEVPASNSVAGPPAALAVDSLNQYAYIIETFSPRPSNNEPHTFSDLNPGNKLTVYDIKNTLAPKLIATHTIPERPDSIDVSPDGQWLIISFHPNTNGSKMPLGLYKMNKGEIALSIYPDIPHWNTRHRLIFSSWHPTKNIFSVINQTTADVSFYEFNEKEQSIVQWGNTVSVGKSPFIGRFSQNGKHFLVNNLFWGNDVQGKWNEAPNGTIANIALDVDSKTIRHALSSQVMVGASPEGFALSPDGSLVVSANMERSWLPYDDPRQSWYSSLTLIQRDSLTGAMNVLHTYPFDSILPESLVFDATSKHLAVATYDHFNPKERGGSIDFFRIVSDPLNKHKKMIMQMRNSVSVTRGVHSMVLLKR